ncbi:MAG: hypothetical protein HY647_10830 [Acidobacteria bacterium]|nr:hypothetical protein [Acidobacteriota bacterium]
MKEPGEEKVSSASQGGKALWASLAALLLSLPLVLLGYENGPPPGITGGVGEPDCRQCHFDHPLNAPGHSLRLEGLPERYQPGKGYTLSVRLEPAPATAGFQLSVRFAGGAKKGMQAGQLRAFSEQVQVVHAGNGSATSDVPTTGLQYAQHTGKGTKPGAAGWSVLWTAPEKPEATERTEAPEALVVFHVAANAADGDVSPLGDFIYTLEEVRAPGVAANSRAEPQPGG